MQTRALLALLAALWLTALAMLSAQADEAWLIPSFHSDIRIATDSSLSISEDIRVDFGSLQKHGIFRTTPTRYRYDDTHDRSYDLTVRSVTDGSRPVPYTTSVVEDNEVIKIGDANVTLSGAQRYVIAYKIVGAMNSFADHDELFWNVDGGLWPVPKQKVSATVFIPTGSFQKAACYQGPTGSTEPCTSENTSSSATYSSTRELGSGEQMSVVTGLNKGAVNVPAPLLEARKRQFPQDAFDVNPLTVGVGLLLLLAGVGLIVRFWLRHGRDRAYRTLYNGLFGSRQQVKISELKGTFHSTLNSAESEVYADAMSRRFFRARPDMVRLATVGVAILIALFGVGLTFVLGITFGGGLIGVAVILVGVVLAVMHRAMASRTAAGREVMQKTLGFRLYMTTAEKYRQQFAEKAEIFTQLLPYAIVFGCVARWSKAFEGIDTSASNSWYVGNAPFQAAFLSSSLESMNSSLSSAIASTPPSSGSSSGFGGGGSSGGGGGGGGGGSW